MKTPSIEAFGLIYKIPQAYLLHATPLFHAELSGRTCYSSFDKSEHESIRQLQTAIFNLGDGLEELIPISEREINEKGSDLLHQLSHVYHHESVIEHTNMNFILSNVSRGVLQELARHRIGVSFSVQSTRYTMSNIINSFLVTDKFFGDSAKAKFVDMVKALDVLITVSEDYNTIELGTIFDKLSLQKNILGEYVFFETAIAKSNLESFISSTDADTAMEILNSKAKRNVGDAFKHIITDNFSVQLGFSANLRALKNLFDLRLSGAAYWQIQLLAAQIYRTLPENYLDLVVNDAKRNTYVGIANKLESGKWE